MTKTLPDKIPPHLMTLLCYGSESSLRLDGASATSIRPKLPAEGDEIPEAGVCGADTIAAVRRALAQPLELPPLAQATVPGDTAAVAVPDAVPQRRELMLGIAAGLREAGIEPNHITLVTESSLDETEQFREDLTRMGLAGVAVETHNPDDDQQLAFVGVASDEQPLRLNRRLVEADLTMLLSASPHPMYPAEPGRFRGLFPQFGDRSRQRRGLASRKGPPGRQRGAAADEAGWLLGVAYTVHATPGPQARVAQVVAGEPAAVERTSTACRKRIWTRPVARRGDLAIAALAGDSHAQTWAYVARAVATANSALTPGGAIVVCSEVSELPGAPLSRLRSAVDLDSLRRQLRRDQTVDARTAILLIRALSRGAVYLMSKLPPSTVESLGITPVADAAELQRLVRNHRHCVLLHEAQELTLRTSRRRRRSETS